MTLAPKSPPLTPDGDRIAKVLSRTGVASRREAERMIELGQVAVNGKIITSPALNVTDRDRITVDGQPIGQPEPARLWLYYKPEGLVTSNNDEKGRDTIFDHLPEDLPRVMSIGRLDLNSEGLLLLTNDGGLKRKLELPSTGWLRRYRVRVRGTPAESQLEALRAGMTIDGDRFAPMQVALDRQQGGNAWLTLGLREGRNREIRRAMESQGFLVNRLIRISYGPFQLGTLASGEIEEVRARVLRDQLGEADMADDIDADDGAKKPGKPTGKPAGKPTGKGPRKAPGKAFGKPSGKDAPKGRPPRGDGPAKPRSRTDGDDRRDAKPGPKGPRKPWSKDGAARPERTERPERKPWSKDGKPRPARSADRPDRDGDRKPWEKRGDKRDDKPGGRPAGKPAERRFAKPGESRPPRDSDARGKPRFERDDKPRPARDGASKEGGKPRFDRDAKPSFDRPKRGAEDRPRNDRAAERAAEKAEREEKKKKMLTNPGTSMRKDATGAPKRGSARKGGSRSPGAGLYGSRDLGSKKPRKP